MRLRFGIYYFLFFAAVAASQPFTSLYLSTKGISSEQIGFILAIGAAAGIFAQPALGFISDHVGDTRLLLLTSALLSPLFFAGYTLTRSLVLLVAVTLAFTIVQSVAPLADALTIQEGVRSQFDYGQIRLWGALSFALTSIAAGYLYHRISISLVFATFALLSILVAVVCLGLPKRVQAVQHRETKIVSFRSLVKDLPLLSFILICFILGIASSMNFTFLPLYFKALHYPMGLVGANFTVAALVEVPLFSIAGRLMERFGRLPILMVGTACFLTKYIVMTLAPGPVAVIALQALDGVGYALYWSASVQTVAYLAPKDLGGTAQTLFGAIAGSMSSIVGMSLGGWIFQQYGPLYLYRSMSGLAFLALGGFTLFLRVHRDETPAKLSP